MLEDTMAVYVDLVGALARADMLQFVPAWLEKSSS